jgi:UDP-glucose 4-epimerase
MKRAVLITGAAGMVAHHVTNRLVEKYHVVGLDDLSGGSRLNIHPDIRFIEGSCLDSAKLKRICNAYSPRFIIHCAAMAAENLSHNVRAFTYANNLVGEANVRNAAVNFDVECMVSLSSIAVMGHQQPPFTEDTQPHPADPYGISKYAGELDAKTAKEFFGLNYVVFRPHNVIGTKQNMADRYRNVAAIFCRAIREGRPLPIFGDGLQTRAFSPVSYVADIIAASLERPNCWNQIFNVGSDEPMTIMELKRMLEEIEHREFPVEHLETRPEAVHAHMTHEKAKCYFSDIEQTETVAAVLIDMLMEARLDGVPPYQQGPEIEVAKNLPPSWKTSV